MRDERHNRQRRPTLARDHLRAAERCWREGEFHEAATLMRRAQSSDPTDPLVNQAVIKAELELAQFAELDGERAARAILAASDADIGALNCAAKRLQVAGVRHFSRLHADRHLGGWICWSPGPALAVALLHGDAELSRSTIGADDNLTLNAIAGAAAHIRMLLLPHADHFEILLDGTCVERGSVSALRRVPRRQALTDPRDPSSPAIAGQTTRIAVIMPVYDDFEATRLSLASAIEACHYHGDARPIVIDDAARDARIAPYLDRLARDGAIELLRNAANLGFVASVNRALAAVAPADDIVLLNADAYLPRTALGRLAAVAYQHPAIGTVTPLSNNGELVNFPGPVRPSATPSRVEAEVIDDAAWRANGTAVVDLPNGVGFCLYVKRSCLAAVGGLGDLYHRGYYEDVDFCLRARALGFRNVCAPGVFVAHEGTRSFKSEKRALVKRNQKVLLDRFPDISVKSDTYRRADPLAHYRAMIAATIALPGGRRDAELPAGGERA